MRFFKILGACALMSIPSATSAADPSPKALAQAETLEKEGNKSLLMGKAELAQTQFEACLKIAPHAPCHRQLGMLFAQQDKLEKAREHYRAYVELAPEAEDVAEIQAILEKETPAKEVPSKAAEESPRYFGFLSLSSEPKAVVMEGDRKLGETPLSKVRLSAGPHMLRLIDPSTKRSGKIRIAVEPNTTKRYQLRF